MKLSESVVGGYDAILTPVPYQVYDFDITYGPRELQYYLNYTQVTSLYGEKYNIAPRTHRCS